MSWPWNFLMSANEGIRADDLVRVSLVLKISMHWWWSVFVWERTDGCSAFHTAHLFDQWVEHLFGTSHTNALQFPLLSVSVSSSRRPLQKVSGLLSLEELFILIISKNNIRASSFYVYFLRLANLFWSNGENMCIPFKYLKRTEI